MSFAIKRWSGLITPADIHPQPVVYIQPDINLISFANQNKNILVVKVEGTGLAYDNQVLVGSFMSSENGPHGCRPNFFQETGLYAIVLQSPWFGEPEDEANMGFVNILNLKVVDGVMIDDKTERSLQQANPSNAVMASRPNGFFGISNNDMVILGFGIFIFILVVIVSLREQVGFKKAMNTRGGGKGKSK